jgi:rod shape-determining protein MreD
VSLALRVALLVFVAAVVQVGTISGTRLLGAEPDVLLVTIVAVGLVAGSIPGAVAGFVGGLLVDVMSLATLGTTSIVLILAGYWAGRYGETTGRGRRYAPSLAAFAITLLATVGGLAIHFLLGQSVSARTALGDAVPTAILAALLVVAIHRVSAALIGPSLQFERARQVEIV